MKTKFITMVLGSALLLIVLSGCGDNGVTSLVNTMEFDAREFSSIQLDYDDDDIRVLTEDTDRIILKEYMSQDKKKYYAQTNAGNGKLLVTEGKRPKLSDFESYIELCIPKEYSGSLSLHSTSGIIENAPLALQGSLKMETTGGAIRASEIEAEAIKVVTTDGTVDCSGFKTSSLNAVSTNGGLGFRNIEVEKFRIETTGADTTISNVTGAVDYKSKNGNLTVTGAKGSAVCTASGDGDINVSCQEVRGNISAYAKNGRISMKLPAALAFKFTALTREGNISTPFDSKLSVKERSASGVIGDSPSLSVDLETRNGDISVEY